MNKTLIVFILIVFLCILSPSFALDNATEIDSDIGVSNGDLNLSVENDCEIIAEPDVLDSDDFKSGETVYLSNGNYEYESSSCSLNDVSIIGQEREKTVIDFNNISIDTNNVILKNLTILNANFKNQGNFMAVNVIFENGHGQMDGKFPHSYGGSIYTAYSTIYVPHTISLTNCSFINNHAEYGGVIYINNGYLEIDNCLFLNNYALQYGGAIAIEKANKVSIKQSKFVNDYSLYDAGGAIFIVNSNLNGENLEIFNCSATFGGAIAALNSNVELDYINASDNLARFDGGAVYQMYGKVLINNSMFANNHAKNGGAIFFDNITSTCVVYSNFTSNNALNCAGAQYLISNSNMVIENNTFENNTALTNNDSYYTSILAQIIKDLNYTQFTQQITEISTLPRYYNLVDEGYSTPAKDQEDGGNCWAYSIMAALESSILKSTNITYDLSEGNAKNLMALYSDYGWNKQVNKGGNDNMAIGYLVGWLGPILESQDPSDPRDMISPLIDPLMHIQNVIFIKRNYYLDNNGIKEAILKYGGVVTGIYYDSIYLKDNSYYYFGSEYTDHSVVIVGWDDDYSRYNFADIPDGNGAFIAKNSWGDEWADKGYFYVSYYDTRFAQIGEEEVTYVFPLNDEIKYEKNYQYDFAGKTNYLETGKRTVWYENIFTATDDEYLAAVSTFFEKQTTWEINVYVNDTLKTTKSGSSPCGYYTIPLGDLISLHEGDVFKVRFKISTNQRANVPVSDLYYLNKLTYQRGVSFISFNGKNWQDLYDYLIEDGIVYTQVACIKAFTISDKLDSMVKLDVAEKGLDSIKINALVSDSYGNPLNTGKVIFHLDNQTIMVNVRDGVASLNYSFKNKGEYNISAVFIADNYNSSNTSLKVEMGGILQFDITNVTYGEKIRIAPYLTDLNGFKLNDKLNLTISNHSYLIDNSEFVIPDLFDADEYEAVLTCGYLKEVKPIRIFQKESSMSITVNNMSGKALITVLVNGMITDNVIVNVNGSNYAVDLGNVLIDDLCGNYIAIAYWAGDKNYLECKSSQIFNVLANPDIRVSVEDIHVGETAIVKIFSNKNITGDIIVNVGSKNYTVNESREVIISNLSIGEYVATVYYLGDGRYHKSSNSTQFKVNAYEVQISSDGQVDYGEDYSIIVNGIDGKPAQSENVEFKLGKVSIVAKTNNQGMATFKATQIPGKYDLTIIVFGKVFTKTIKINRILILKKVKIKKSAKKLILTACLNKVNGKYLKNKKITFKFNNKRYVAKTNSKGVAKVKIKKSVLKKLKVGKKITYEAIYINDVVKRTVKVKK